MSRSEAAFVVPGAVYVLGYTLMNAAKSVFEGWVLVTLSPAFVAVHCFVLAQVVYLATHRDRGGLLHKIRGSWRHVVAINVTTALSWLAVLYALDALEPAVVNGLIVGAIPLLTLALAPRLRPNAPILRQELIAAFGCALSVLALVAVSAQGLSGLGALPWTTVAVGVVAALLTALGVSTNTYVTKALTERDFSSADIMTVRFTLLNTLAFAILVAEGSWSPYTPAVLGTIAILTGVGVFIGIYLLQIGIARTEPMTVSLLFSTNLIFTYLAQLADPRLAISTASLACVLLLTAFTAYGTLSAGRARRPAPA